MRNYIALLGWGDQDDETIIATDELVKRFDIARVSKNPAQFDEKKLRWMNGRYVRALSDAELTAALERFTGRSGLAAAVAISAEKIQTLADFWPLAGFLLDGPVDDPAARETWLSGEAHRTALAAAVGALDALGTWELAAIEGALRGVVEALQTKPKDVFQPVRVAIAGTSSSPGIFESLAVLGREESLRRLAAA